MSSHADRRFGWAWLMFAVSLACHVVDEAAHDFLSVYTPPRSGSERVFICRFRRRSRFANGSLG